MSLIVMNTLRYFLLNLDNCADRQLIKGYTLTAIGTEATTPSTKPRDYSTINVIELYNVI